MSANNSSNQVSLTCEEWVLALLYADNCSKIGGKTVFVKELFLLGKEVFPDIDNKFGFMASDYGPFSIAFQISLNALISKEQVEQKTYPSAIDNLKNRNEYELTETGKQIASKVFDMLPIESRRTLTFNKISWRSLGFWGILRYVYLNYPEYATKSRIKDKVLYSEG